MLNRTPIALRLFLMGLAPLFALLFVLLLSYQASVNKDQLFNRLYSEHLILLDDLLATQQLLEQEALDVIQRYRSRWLSMEEAQEVLQEQMAAAKVRWASYQQARQGRLNAQEKKLVEQFEQAIALYQHWIEPVGSDALQVRILNTSTVRLNASRTDEVAEASHALDELLSYFQNLIEDILIQSSELRKHSKQMRHSSEDVQKSSEEQAEEARHLATSMQQLTVSIQAIVSSTQQAETLVKEAEDLSNQGSKQVQQALVSIESLASGVTETTAIIDQLGQDVGGIFKILEIIENISERTNLLALNAAIEAARAGEAGRGFAVVADEVRSLSANTTQATDSISQLLNKLQAQAQKAVSTMDKASEQVGTSVDFARNSNQALEAIQGAVNTLREQIINISTATSEQQNAVQLSHTDIEQLNQGIGHLSDEASNSASVSNELEAMSRQLRNRVRQFKVSKNPDAFI